MDNQYQQNSWQTSYPPNTQCGQQQGPATSGNQFPQLPTQANTYSSSTTTTTQQQTTTSSTHYDQPYIPTYQNPAPQVSQYYDQSQFSQIQQLQPPVSQPQASQYFDQSQFSQFQQLQPPVSQSQASQYFDQSQSSQTQQLPPSVCQPQAAQHFGQSQFPQTQQLQPSVYQPQTVPQQPLCSVSQTTTTQLVSGNTTVQQSQFSQYQQVPPPPQEYHQTMPQLQPAPQRIPAQLTGTNMTTHQSSSGFQQSIEPTFEPPLVEYTPNQPQVSQYQQPCPPLPQSQTQTTAQQFLSAAPPTQATGGGGAIQQVSVCVPQLAPPPTQPHVPKLAPQISSPVPHPAEPSSKKKTKPETKSKTKTDTKTKTTTTTTKFTRKERYEGEHAGGEARKAAEEKGEEAVKRYEKRVQKLIHAIDVCPNKHPWYNMDVGYLCAEGIHLLYHEDIDLAFKRPGWLPQVAMVNSFDDPEGKIRGMITSAHPPEIDFWQPMHRTHFMFCRKCAHLGYSSNGKSNPRFAKCQAVCFKGGQVESDEVLRASVRAEGFNPDLGRHGMFNR